MSRFNERYLIIIGLGVVILFFGSALAIEYVNNINYERVLADARACVLVDLETNGVPVLYESPDWYGLMRMSLISADSFKMFRQRCLWENTSVYYDVDRGGFYVVVPKYNQIWEYGVKISEQRQFPNPFFTYKWENSIE